MDSIQYNNKLRELSHDENTYLQIAQKKTYDQITQKKYLQIA